MHWQIPNGLSGLKPAVEPPTPQNTHISAAERWSSQQEVAVSPDNPVPKY